MVSGFVVRRRSVLRPHVTTETWLVLIFRGGEFTREDNDVIGGELLDLVQVTCQSSEFGTALLQAGYDLRDRDLEFARELFTPAI